MSGGLGGRPHTARSNSWQQPPPLVPAHAHHARPFARQQQQAKGPWGFLQQDRWCLRVFRMIGTRRLGMGIAALLALISILMLVTYASLISFGHPQDVDDTSEKSKHGGQPSTSHHEKYGVFTSPAVYPEFISRKPQNGSVPRSPYYFSDGSLPSGHPCQEFTLPPPPADKKRTGPRPCPVCYLPVEKAIEVMHRARSAPVILQQLSYVAGLDTKNVGFEEAGSEFGGYPTLAERETSFAIRESMHVHCGFVKGRHPGVGTGFDISADDRADMNACKGIVVASAIFGNYDQMQQPKNISKQARKDVCFFMFIDEETGYAISEDGTLDVPKKIGLWRVVLVHNLPYTDARRNGKVPKLLIHRLFPNAKYSLWVDGKLELVVDPYQILERFLWRSGDVFAISKHYKRFDVFEEAEANKAAGKYDNVSIDAQVDFYRQEGLTPYSDAKLPIVSDVPEGCVIIREHTPLTNLFSCLWFNEVDRFTSRDQLSFGIARDKVMARAPWRASMFLDCERRNFVVQGYHRDLLEQKLALGQNATITDSESTALAATTSRSPGIVDLEKPVYSSPRPRPPPMRIGPPKPKKLIKRRRSKGAS